MAVAVLLTVSSCSRSPELARGPIELGDSPTVVRIDQPVPSSGSAWEICFEFDRPRDSHEADRIHAVLLTREGQRHELVETKLDRRGESVVCQMGRVAPIQTGFEATPHEQSVTYVAIELSLSAGGPLRLRGIRGGSRL